MRLSEIKATVSDCLERVDQLTVENLSSEIPLIEQIGHYLSTSGGKRIRPLLVLLCARACGYQGPHHITLAVAIEFIHAATLLHDDVVDESHLRRGTVTVNQRWGNEAAVLTGDFLYSRAFQLLVSVANLEVLRILADATNRIAEGEVLQLGFCQDTSLTEAQYLQMIDYKTATLFQAATAIGAVVADCAPALQATLGQFGHSLGMIYQLTDDVLDYNACATELGKQTGDDLAQGKLTLPLIYLLKHGNQTEKNRISRAIADKDRGELPYIQAAIASSGGIAYTVAQAQAYGQQARFALHELPDSPYRRAAGALVDFILKRTR